MTFEKKRILITGPTSGLGKETAKQLVEAGHELIFACRNLDEGRRLKNLWTKDDPNQISLLYVNLSSRESIVAFKKVFYDKYDYLDVLIHNAGVYLEKKTLTDDGIDMTMMVNFVAPYMLTKLLTDALKLGHSPLIINMVSKAGFHGSLSLKTDFFETSRSGFKAYADSKLAMMMQVYHDHEAFVEDNIALIAVQPGIVKTKMLDGHTIMMKLNKWIMNFIAKSPETSCETAVLLVQTKVLDPYVGKLMEKKSQICRWSDAVKDEKKYYMLKEMTEHLISDYLKQ